jgi:hypothetical protein
MKKRKNTLLWISIALLLAALAAWGTYQIIGSSVDSQGRLQEPFALIPISFLFLFLGLISGLVYLISRLVRRLRNTKK